MRGRGRRRLVRRFLALRDARAEEARGRQRGRAQLSPRRGRAAAAALADQRAEPEQHGGRPEEPREALDRNATLPLQQLLLGNQPQLLLVDVRDALTARAQRTVDPAGDLGDPRERLLIQPRSDDLSARVLHEAGESALRSDREDLARGRADADGEHLDPVLRRLLGLFDALGLEVLAVRDEDEDLVVRALLHGPPRFGDRRREVGPLGRNELGVHGVEAFPKRVLVVGERAGQIRLAGERHQADAVSVELLDEVEDRQLGSLETIGRDVLGEHAPRGVESRA